MDITKEYVLDVLHALCLLKDPEDNEKYERAFLTNDDVWDVLKDFIDGLCDTFSPKQLAKWMANDGSWGQLERRQADGARQRGRQLHLLKSQYRGMYHNILRLSKSKKKNFNSSIKYDVEFY